MHPTIFPFHFCIRRHSTDAEECAYGIISHHMKRQRTGSHHYPNSHVQQNTEQQWSIYVEEYSFHYDEIPVTLKNFKKCNS